MRVRHLRLIFVAFAMALVGTTWTVPSSQTHAAVPPAMSPIEGGASHTCALSDGGLWCWGGNGYGALGNGTLSSSSVPIRTRNLPSGVTALAAGFGHSCAVMNGGAWCWGHNNNGQLGDGSTTDRSLPAAVSGLASGVTAISAGWDHTCAIKDGAAWCWGLNTFSRLGDGTGTSSTTPVAVVGLTSGVSAITAGNWHTCAIREGGAWCWGHDVGGQLGDGPGGLISAVPVAVSEFATGASAISAGFGHTCAIKDAGAWCWGDNYNGALGTGLAIAVSHVPLQVDESASGVTAITAGGYHSCLVKSGGAWCWGMDLNAQLGDGTPGAASGVPGPVLLLSSGVAAITGGHSHTCAIKVDGSAWCWGINVGGGLGDGTLTQRNVPVLVLWPGNAADTDGDGCTNVQETGPTSTLGGDRDPLDFWDFYDVTGDAAIDLGDTLAILGEFGLTPGAAGYSALFDRHAPELNAPWRTAPATGANIGIDLGDALLNLQSFGHSCAPP